MSDTDETFPLRAAAIDIGSNAMRLLAAEFQAPTQYTILEQMRVPVRLGHGVFITGQLAPDAVDAAVDALSLFARTMRNLDITHYRAVATSAVRDARDKTELLERALGEAGIAIEVIGGIEEARLVHLGVTSRVEMGRGRFVLVDLGGGSVEVSLVSRDAIHRSVSHDIGSVRLLEELSMNGDDPAHFRRRVEEYIAAMRMPSRRARAAGFIATGGNAEAMARIAGTEPDERGVSTLKLSAVHSLVERLAALSIEERIRLLELRPDRADVLLPAAIVYERLCAMAGFQEILVPFVGLKEGVLLDLTDDLARHGPHSERQEVQIRHSAHILGRRYHFDQAHARQVMTLALSLFDQTRELHELGEADRRLLLAAALLHDIGTFIGYRKHHKHSYYILSQAELPGLSSEEMEIIALTARYHRKSEPSSDHSDFTKLSERAQERVTRLAALLRVADALDREHLQHVHDVRVEIDDDDVVLHVRGRGDLMLEQWAVTKKSGLFEKTFGYGVRVRSAVK